MSEMARKTELPGSIYKNKNRWWWKVRLPGEDKPKSRPLKAVGTRFATSDRNVAEEVARQMWELVLFQSEQPVDDPTNIAGLVKAYLMHAKEYYKAPDGKSTTKKKPAKKDTKDLAKKGIHGRGRSTACQV